jgi:hypothetical protein
MSAFPLHGDNFITLGELKTSWAALFDALPSQSTLVVCRECTRTFYRVPPQDGTTFLCLACRRALKHESSF